MHEASRLVEQDTDRIQIAPTIAAGVEACREDQWDLGLELLWKTARRAGEGESLPAAFYAYTGFGVARVQRRLAEGERLCRHAIKLDPGNPENYLLLAKVLILRRKRKAAVDTLLKGLRLAPTDARLRRFQRRIGFRRPPVVSFLHRDNPLNRYLGQRRHRRLSGS